MAEEVAALTVRLEATAARFERDMQRARTSMDRTARQMERRAGSLDSRLSKVGARFGAALGIGAGAVGVTALVRTVNRTVTELDALGKTADKVGLTTDTLQELRSAAEQTGVATRTLDMAMQRFSRRVAEARQGTGEAKNVLAELGVALTDNEGRARSNEEVLNDVADAMAGMENQSDQLRVAFKLFDSEGAALVNTLGKGSAALDNMRERAREANAVIGEDSIRAAESLRNEIDLLSTSFSNTFVSAVGTAATALNRFLNIGANNQLATTRRQIALMQENIETTQGQITGGSILSGETLLRRLEGFQSKFLDLREQERGILAEIDASAGPAVVPRVSTTTGTTTGGASRGGGGGGSAPGENTLVADTAAQIRDRITARQEEMALIGLTDREQAALNATFERARFVRELEARAADENVVINDAQRSTIAALADEEAALTLAIYDKAAALETLADASEATRKRQEDAAKAVADLGDRMTRAIQSANSFEDALKNVGLELANLTLQAIAGQGPLAALFNGGGGGGGGIGGFIGSILRPQSGVNVGSLGFGVGADARFMHSGGAVGVAGMTKKVDPAVFAGAPRMHSGGIVGLKPDEVPIIGQRGEMVIPKGAANSGGVTIGQISQNVTVNGSNLGPEQLSRAVQEGLKRDRPQMLADVQRKFDTTGSYLRRSR